MAWANGPLTLYHGTDEVSARSIVKSVSLLPSRILTDFGSGFYTTTSLAQAKNWANVRCRTLSRGGVIVPMAAIVQLDVARDVAPNPDLATLDTLFFITEGSGPDFWDLVTQCRTTSTAQHSRPFGGYYDVVGGPVTLWPQTLVIKDCDQVGFHTDRAVALLNASTRSIPYLGTPLF